MAMTLAMDREPEVARFIDTYKFDQDMATKRDRYGGGTSLPLNSDGYEDKQKALRDERHKDWLVQQDKPKEPVYYRVGTPEQGFPGLGEYERQRQEKNIARQKEYNEMLRKQRQAEQQKLEARRYAPQPRPAQPLGPQMDYNAASEQAKAEERKAYQDYMKAKEERYWALRGRPVTPPGGLNIGQYDRQVKEQAPQKKQEYKRMLDEQQKEHMFLRARQEPEMAVIDRNAQSSQFLANKPPPGPSYGRGRDEAFKTNSYANQPPPAPEQGYQYQSDYPPADRYMRQPQSPAQKREFQRPPFSSDAHKTYRRHEDGLDGTYGKPDQSERPRSRRSLDAERKQSPRKQNNAAFQNKVSPRRMKQQLYEDSEEVSLKRREASKERQKEYNDFLKMKDEKRKHDSEVFQQQHSGKPAEIVKNPFYSSDDYEKFQKELKKKQEKEYSEFLSKKKAEVRNRNWNFDETGVLELKGDDAVQLKKRELRAERREDYNQYISQMKAPTRRNWPEPEGQDGLLVKSGEYDNVRQMYDDERKRDYNDTMRRRREMGLDLTPPSAPAEPLQSRYEYFNPMVNVLGRYEDFRKKLKDDRRRDFRHHMDQVKAEDAHRRNYVSTAPTIAREETPLVNSLGLYEMETKNKMRAQRKKDMEEYVHEQEKHWTPRVTVKENLMPHVADSETPLVNYMGQYDKDRLKFRLERNRELRDFAEKKKHELRNPYDHYVYPTVAVAEKPIVDYMGAEVERRKHDLREERKKDYELFKKQVASNNQKVAHPGRRHEFVDSASGPYGGLFHGLGEHGNRSEDLNRERHREYNERLEQQYAGRDRPGGRPKWVQETLPNNTDRGRSPMKTQPPADQYQQMLNEKRREEANMRRYEDPEYQDRLAQGRDRGEAGQRYGY